MADRLPFGGSPNATPNKPKKMLYTRPSWTLPACDSNLTDLEYWLRVGKITQEEYDAEMAKKAQLEVAALSPAKRTAVVKHPRAR